MSFVAFRRVPLACAISVACASIAAPLPAAEVKDAVALDLRLCAAQSKMLDSEELALYETDLTPATSSDENVLRVLRVPADELAAEVAGTMSPCLPSENLANQKWATAKGLRLSMPGEETVLLDKTAVSYSGSKIAVASLDPIICHSFAPSGDGLTLVLQGPDGRGTSDVSGWQALNYDVGSGELHAVPVRDAEGQPLTQCFTFPYARVDTQRYLNLFSGGFENQGLAVEVLVEGSGGRVSTRHVADVGSTINYDVRVSNLSSQRIQQIHLKEFVPQDGLERIGMDSSKPSTASCASGGGSCFGASFSPGTITGAPFSATILALDAGASMTFSITRASSPRARKGDFSLIAAGVFSDPSVTGGESELEDNLATLSIIYS